MNEIIPAAIAFIILFGLKVWLQTTSNRIQSYMKIVMGLTLILMSLLPENDGKLFEDVLLIFFGSYIIYNQYRSSKKLPAKSWP